MISTFPRRSRSNVPVWGRPRSTRANLASTGLAALVGLGVLGAGPGIAPANAAAPANEALLVSQRQSTARTAASALRVMVLGSSISQGYPGSDTWRYFLYRKFAITKTPVDFVGPFEWPRNGGNYLHEFDHDHDAHVGARLTYHLDRITDITTYKPDVVLMEAGINDLRDGRPAADVAADITAYVTQARARRPATKFVIGEVAPATNLWGTPCPDPTELNQLLRQRFASDPQVAFAQVGTAASMPWDPGRFTFDGLHPNPSGEALMALRYAQGLAALKLLPTPGEAFPTLSWNPKPRATVKVSGPSTAQVTFPGERVRITMWSSRIRLVRVGRQGAVTTSSVHDETKGYRLSGLVRGATYEVRLIPTRGHMVGLPGPATRFTMPKA